MKTQAAIEAAVRQLREDTAGPHLTYHGRFAAVAMLHALLWALGEVPGDAIGREAAEVLDVAQEEGAAR